MAVIIENKSHVWSVLLNNTRYVAENLVLFVDKLKELQNEIEKYRGN
jgi:hypothetical protein